MILLDPSKWTPEGVTAAATGIIAVFTVVLALATIIQAAFTNAAIRLARDEFNSSHRPRIIMKDIWCEPGGDVFYMLVNTGEATARIVESWIFAEFIPSGRPIRPLRSAGYDDLGQLVFAAGEMKDLTFSVPAEIGAYMMVPDMMRIGTDDRRPMVGEFYFTGAILYADDAGNRRRSVFRRQWDRDRKCFVRLSDPDQEYAD